MKNNINSFLNATVGVLKLPSVAFFLFQNVREQKKFLNKHVLPELQSFKANNDGSLKKEDFNKFSKYYALGVPAILGYAFGVLRGSPLNFAERTTITYLGGISGLLDDLFDEQDKEVMHLKDFIIAPEKLLPINSYEALLKHCYLRGLRSSENPEALKQQAKEVFNTQAESELQLNKKLSEKKIKELTFLKGGHSFLFYRLCLDHKLEKEEKEMIYQLGGLMQLGNDIFDVYEDVQQNIETLAIKSESIHLLRNSFTSELNITVALIEKCNSPKKQLQEFTRIVLFGLSRVYVCLDQFEKLQTSETSLFQPEEYSRNQLICDMQLLKNKNAAIKYYLRLHSQYL
ncbi:hypothetical protein BC962_2071 [Gillisia mitskevichiae]|uniref:Geranylgeranyl pyrophosphate synthase n=1 Tax=Gillisia mitskevichiae TaxID=270921 RepID=A0A495PW84_9FLAO|nr:hypothetical protein [Gillisia mitskevichiae]RKS53812.1 hypothetical protein BC962_2071 [Gillisia mitskevichiae]